MNMYSVGKAVIVVDVKLIGQITPNIVGSVGVISKILDQEQYNIVVNFNGVEIVFDKEELQTY